MKYTINDINMINNKEITEEKKEEVGYQIEEVSEFVDILIGWISEATRDKELMKDDLKYLMTLDDQYIFSSRSTNEYVAYSEDPEEFNRIAEELTQ